jgi:hypothetical protein
VIHNFQKYIERWYIAKKNYFKNYLALLSKNFITVSLIMWNLIIGGMRMIDLGKTSTSMGDAL